MALTAQRKPTIHAKKQRGAHHRHSKHYLKAYSPYLPLLMLVIIGLAINSFWSHGSHQVLGAATSLYANELLADTNKERSSKQEPALVLNADLNSAAQAKANDMAARNYWSHDAPDGTTPWSFVAKTGYNYQAAGENLAYGFNDADAVLAGWMNSPAHKANILNQDFQDIGFGIANVKNYQGKGPTTIVVAMYGQPTANSFSVSMTVNPPADSVSTQPQVAGAATTNPYRNVSRIQAITGSPAWTVSALSAIILIALAFLVLRHSLAWHRVLIRSEDFVLSHKLLDAVVLSALIASIVLTRAAGFIG